MFNTRFFLLKKRSSVFIHSISVLHSIFAMALQACLLEELLGCQLVPKKSILNSILTFVLFIILLCCHCCCCSWYYSLLSFAWSDKASSHLVYYQWRPYSKCYCSLTLINNNLKYIRRMRRKFKPFAYHTNSAKYACIVINNNIIGILHKMNNRK